MTSRIFSPRSAGDGPRKKEKRALGGETQEPATKNGSEERIVYRGTVSRQLALIQPRIADQLEILDWLYSRYPHWRRRPEHAQMLRRMAARIRSEVHE